MKSIFYLLFAGLLFFSVGCGETKETPDDELTVEEVEEQAEEASEELSADLQTGANYEVKTLKADLPSPRKEMTGTIGETKVVVNYGSPSVKGREIWGGLEPYDKVWRAGANEATTIEVSEDVMVNGQRLPAGKYGFFVIPKKTGKWVAIFNETADQWGAYEYDQSKDVVRVNVMPTEMTDSREMMDFMMENNKVVLQWDKVALPLEITTG